MKAATLGVALLILATAVSPAPAQMAPGGLRPGDMVRLKIWREPDLSGEFQVDENGNAVFPKLGPLAVTHLSAASLKDLLVRRYTDYLRDPSIEVRLLRRVSVSGEVRSPGLYQVDQTETIADVLAKAGGATTEGKGDRIELRRSEGGQPIMLHREAPLFSSGVRSGDQIFVPPRSWFSRNAGPLIGAGLTAAAIVVTTIIKP